VTIEFADSSSEVGTLLNKDNLLSDAVAIELGLTQTDPVPSDALIQLQRTAIQYSTMPTASEDNEGHIALFTGITGTYTNGSAYMCVSDGESSPTYSWRKIVFNIIPSEIGAASTAELTSGLAGKSDVSVIFDAVLAAADWGADCLNLFDEVWESGALAGASGDEYSSTTRLRSSNYVTISGGATYHVQNSLGVNVQIFWWNGSTYLSYNDLSGGNSSVTAPASATRARLVIDGSTTISPADSGWTMFVAGAVGKPYEPQGRGIHLKASDYSALSGVTATSVQELLPSRYGESTPNQREKLREALLYDGFQTAGTEIVYIADGDVPDEDIPIRIIMRGDL